MAGSILVHSCTLKKDKLCPRHVVVSGTPYVGELGRNLEHQEWYCPLPKKCRCRRFITVAEATEFVLSGQAVWILQFKHRKGEVVLNDDAINKIWMRVEREKVPRVDLITRADIERSIIGSERKSKHYQFNQKTRRFENIQKMPGFTVKEWTEDALKEAKFEKRIRDQYSKYIEECHLVTLNARIALKAPFRPDPFEGRSINILWNA